MNDLNNLLTRLMDTVSKAVSNGKNIDDIASELGVDKDWVKMIINNQSDSEQKVLDAIKKDTSAKISSKKDLSEISGVSLNRIDDILEKLLKLRKVSFAALWGRGILPDNKPDAMIKTFLHHYIHDICKGLSDTNKDIVKNNIDEIMKEFNCSKKEEYKQLELLPELPATPTPEMKPVEVSLKTNTWNEVEVNTLSYMIEHNYSIEKMANVLGKDADVVREKRYILISSGLVTIKNNVIEAEAEEKKESKPEPVERYVPTKGRVWTTSEIEKLKTMLAEGKTSIEIAVALNRPSRQTIDQKIYNLRKEGVLPSVKRNVEHTKQTAPTIVWSDKEIELITKLTETGCVPEDIAQILGKSPTDVSNMVDHLSKTKKITLPPAVITKPTSPPFTRTWSAEEEATVITMRREGYTIREIAEALGRSYTQVNGKVSHLRDSGRL